MSYSQINQLEDIRRWLTDVQEAVPGLPLSANAAYITQLQTLAVLHYIAGHNPKYSVIMAMICVIEKLLSDSEDHPRVRGILMRSKEWSGG